MDTLRLFISVDLPKELHYAIAQIVDGLAGNGLNKVRVENMHFTLKFLGNVEQSRVEEIKEALAKIAFQPFSIKLKGVGVFPREQRARVVWVGCESAELEKLAFNINTALANMFPKEEFLPHLTIARVKGKTDLRKFLAEYKETEFGSFVVHAFCLKQSMLSGSGPAYSDLAVFGNC